MAEGEEEEEEEEEEGGEEREEDGDGGREGSLKGEGREGNFMVFYGAIIIIGTNR